ncbi:MAG: FHA domain-containing protein [Piscinibacter sp.]|nr:FHA domain-containing protein [Piscinibacter sp.]
MGEVKAVVELLERDGAPRLLHVVHDWPLRIGRALDNELPLADPHVAPHHLEIAPGEAGLVLQVRDSDNGVQLGARRLRRGESETLRETGEPPELVLGRTRLRLRLPGHALAPERPLEREASGRRRFGPTLIAAFVLLLGLSFNTWLESDPDTFGRALGAMLLTSVVGTAVWCGLWSLLSKTFTRQLHFGWHLKVFLVASCAWLVVGVVPELLAFSLSWTWIADFGWIATYAVGAAALYFHLLAVEPARPRLLRGVAVLSLAVGVSLSLWFNQQRSDRLGAELYMSHLFPPALRLARPVSSEQFVDGLASLQPLLDRKAKEKPHGDAGDDED